MTVKKGEREKSRVKDLVDVLLLMKVGLNRKRVLSCLENTFPCREGSPAPSSAPIPPDSWREPFKVLASDCGLDDDFDAAVNVLSSYWK